MKTLVDNFSVLSIEKCLLQKLPSMFTPEIVLGLEDNQVESIAAESEESLTERNRATEKLTVLEKTLKILQGLDRHKTAGKFFSGPETMAATNPTVAFDVEEHSSTNEAEGSDAGASEY